MSLKIIKLPNQAKGQFNGGAILENKPIGFPQDGGIQRPYSNLFYWAHAWTPGDRSLIGEHPHQGFEIMSFVLKGSLEHYDSKNRNWRKLNEGDAQIIRSGSGITHAELVNEESEFFQIWFDPNLNETLSHNPTYDDYKSESFPVLEQNGRTTKLYKGKGSPMDMHTKDIEIREISFKPGNNELDLKKDLIYSIYVIEGEILVDENKISTNDFIIVEDRENIKFESGKTFRLFLVSSPKQLAYKTYADRIRY